MAWQSEQQLGMMVWGLSSQPVSLTSQPYIRRMSSHNSESIYF